MLLRIMGWFFLAIGLFELIFPPYFWFVELGAAVFAVFGIICIWASYKTRAAGGGTAGPDTGAGSPAPGDPDEAKNGRNP